MSLRNKFVLALGGVVAVGLLLATFILRTLVYPAFEEVQAGIADRDLARARMAIESELRDLDVKNRDWSQWNETAEFVQGRRPDYPAENLNFLVLNYLGVDLVLFYDGAGALVWSRIVDRGASEITPVDPDALFEKPLQPQSPLVRHAQTDGQLGGLIQSSRGPMLINSRPVLDNLAVGPVQGTVIFGRMLDAERIEAMRRVTEVDLSLAWVRAAGIDAADRDALAELAGSERPRVHRREPDALLSYALLPDVYGEPGFVLRARTSGEVASVGFSTLQLAVSLLALTAIFFVGSLWVLLQRLIVQPVYGLTSHILGIRRSGDLSARFSLARADELGALAREFDALTDELDVARKEMAEARDAALDLARVKSEFLATMSHEIRTPMNGVIGMAELLLDTHLDEKQRRFAHIIQSSADGLLSIINDILDFSKLEAGKVELEQREFSLRALVEDVTILFAGAAQAKDIELVCALPPDLDATCTGDANRLRQVLTNLIGNAVKFTPRGEVVVSVSQRRDEDGVERLRFEVRDTGIGIAPGYRERIFESFSQADASTTRQYGGTGLGLAICRQLVGLMGGEVGVESEPGRGSSFWFDVPLATSSSPPEVRASAAQVLRGARALVVDDNATNREILFHQLAAWNMSCTAVDSARAALQLLRAAPAFRRPFDLVLLDMYMPEMDGLELAQAIQADPGLAGIPMVMLSSVLRAGDTEERTRAGIRAHLVKPVRQIELCSCLADVLGREPAFRRPEPEGPSEPQKSPMPVGAQVQRVLLVEDNPVNQEVAAAMLAALGHRVVVAENGRDALELLSREPCDAVLMDCQMPVMDGYAATAEIRRREAELGLGDRIPIIALTANAVEGDREKCLAADMDDYLGKPFRQGDLRDVLARWLPEAPAAPPQENGAARSVDVDTHPPADPIDREILTSIRSLQSPARPDLLVDVVGAYWSSSAELVDELRESVEQGDAEATRQAAHALKMSSCNLGARQLAQLCDALEVMGRAGDLDGAKDLLVELIREHRRVLDAFEAEVPIKPC